MQRVLATHKKGGEIYAACRAYDGEKVFALILLVEREKGITYTKATCDTERPFYYGCPPRILDLLHQPKGGQQVAGGVPQARGAAVEGATGHVRASRSR